MDPAVNVCCFEPVADRFDDLAKLIAPKDALAKSFQVGLRERHHEPRAVTIRVDHRHHVLMTNRCADLNLPTHPRHRVSISRPL
jgi:hypothetical protein